MSPCTPPSSASSAIPSTASSTRPHEPRTRSSSRVTSGCGGSTPNGFSGSRRARSAISRIESGQYKTSVETLRRLADALELRFVVGFEGGSPDHPVRELVAV
ncbi:MAG: helix-turn-helix transcriptional regulator [Actinobacteria bacterium]|nr:MAG: helix-turn-helix transcriptional regulator [Actinomycetota bacterium]